MNTIPKPQMDWQAIRINQLINQLKRLVFFFLVNVSIQILFKILHNLSWNQKI